MSQKQVPAVTKSFNFFPQSTSPTSGNNDDIKVAIEV